MPTLLLPRFTRNAALVVRLVVVSVPVVVAVLFAVSILFVALFMNEVRQRYALRAAACAVGAATAMTGLPVAKDE